LLFLSSVLGSKFQPTYAREAYPCFDEPALKATFSIIIEHPVGTYSISNWPVVVNKLF
jgi:aminopeptidase N